MYIVLIAILEFICEISASGSASGSIFPAADYYWSMNKTKVKYHTMIDEESSKIAADLHRVKFIKVRRLGYAVRLQNGMQWIDVDAGLVKDCLAFNFRPCGNSQTLTISFWIRLRNTRRILATGWYTHSDQGPGVLIEYDHNQEILTVNMANELKLWKTSLMVRKYVWCHLSAVWTNDGGLRVILNGKLKDPDMAVVDKDGTNYTKKEKKRYKKIITIGLPKNVGDEDNYGDFDMSHLVIYFREPIDSELGYMPEIPLEKMKGNKDDLTTCHRKKEDACINDPCMSPKCKDIEKTYTKYICLDVKHTKCSGYTTTAEPTTAPKCNKFLTDSVDSIFGCGNYPMTSICGNKACYYGTCESVNGKKDCRCDANCTVMGKKEVCGYNEVLKSYITYENICLMKRASCEYRQKIKVINEGYCYSPLQNASYYWPLNDSTNTGRTYDLSRRSPAVLFNNITTKRHVQLGYNLVLDGINDWIDIKNIDDKCISEIQCENGLTVSFWMKFHGGDYIITSGGFADSDALPPGFRIQRDKETNFYKLEVATFKKRWQIFIYEFPKNWFHFTFTFHPRTGLKIYYDGYFELMQNNEHSEMISRNIRRKNQKSRNMDRLYLGRYDTVKDFENYGKFDIAHLAIWNKKLSDDEVKAVFKAKVKIANDEVFFCCYKIQEHKLFKERCGSNKSPLEWEKLKNQSCICPDVSFRKKERECQYSSSAVGMLSTEKCSDRNRHCNELAVKQIGFCKNLDDARGTCKLTCNLCESPFLESIGPKQHFSQQTVIVALLGCIGGLILLLGVTFYFWKVYRTRYHGRFVPPIKTVSLLEVSDYEDEKWPNKYIDSGAYFIRDVPPKKRALPLIPARNSSNHRYQPPDFD